LIARIGRLLALVALIAVPGMARAAGPRIVSLNPCSDAILVEVADADQIVAISAYSRDRASSSLSPAVAARFATTHGTVEEVIALHPDVVIDGAFVAPATLAAYHRLGLHLDMLGTQRDVTESLADIRRLAALAGHPDRGEALVRRITAALAAAAPRPGTPPVEAMVWEWGGMVVGRDTLTGELMERTGFANLPARQGFGQAAIYPIERVLAHPPQVILTVGNDRMLHHPALAALGHVVHAEFPANLLYCGGPSIIRSLQWLAHLRDSLPRAGTH
jgi:iron complex transport system substrate-binding protein